MTKTIDQNTALTLAAMHHATKPATDQASYDSVARIVNGRTHEELKALALAAIWELGTKLHFHAPDDIARIATLGSHDFPKENPS